MKTDQNKQETVKNKCLNCGSRAEEIFPIGCEKCIPKNVLKKHNRYRDLGGYYCPQCGDELELSCPKGDGVHYEYYCFNCRLLLKRF